MGRADGAFGVCIPSDQEIEIYWRIGIRPRFEILRISFNAYNYERQRSDQPN